MIDSDSVAFIQTGVSISLASCAPDGLPSMSRGLGCKLVDGNRPNSAQRRPFDQPTPRSPAMTFREWWMLTCMGAEFVKT